MIPRALAPPPQVAHAAPRGRFAFGFTRRTLLLLLSGTLWFVPAFFVHGFVWGVIAWDGLVLLLATLDGRRLPSPSRIEVQRTWLSAPALGNATEVEIAVTQRGPFLLYCSAIDDLPPAFLESPEVLTCNAYPNIPEKMVYRFLPRRRGDHEAGKLFLRYRSALGLTERWALADIPQTVRIYPALRISEDGELFLSRARNFELQLRKQRQRGLGRDFQSLREYRDGDDLRDICWTAAARRGVLISKQYQVERSQPVWLVIDSGRLLQAKVGLYNKLDYATTAAFAVARLALTSGDRVGLLAYGQIIQQRIAPGRGATHLRHLMDALALVHGEPGEADHLRATATLNRLQPRRSLIVWLTDLAETSMRPEVIDGASQMLRRHLVLFVAIQQKDLVEIAHSQPENVARMYEKAAAQELIQRRDLLLARLREQGALTLETGPLELTAAVLNRYLEVKEKALL